MTRAAKNRPTRTPLGARNRLTFKISDADRKKFNYRFINDQDDRLDRALEAGYEFVESDQKAGDEVAAEGTSVDSRVAKPVGNGVTGYLMRVPREYFEEDQKAKAAQVDKIEEAMNPDKSKNQYGDGISDT